VEKKELLFEGKGREELEKAHNDTLATLRGIIEGSQGFMLVGVVNRDGKNVITQIAAGEIKRKQLAAIVASVAHFSLRICREHPEIIDSPCDCPQCRAARDAKSVH
jgi:hypothetical protein